MDINYFPKNLKFFRKKRGLTQAELGKKAGATRSAISEFEAGKRRPYLLTLYNLSKVLNVSLDTLLSQTRSDPSKEFPHEFEQLHEAYFALSEEGKKRLMAQIKILKGREKWLKKTNKTII